MNGVNSILAIAVAGLVSAAACGRPEPREPSSASEARSHAVETTAATSASHPGASRSARAEETRRRTGFVGDIEALTTENRDFRRVLYTAEHSQLVVMALPPGEHIGEEVHDVDQFFRVEAGTGEVIIGQSRTPIGDGSAIVVPAGARHDVINTGATPLKLYTVYAPPHHRDGVVHPTRAAAERDHEHFDGETSE